MAVKITQRSLNQLCVPEELSLSSYNPSTTVNYYPYNRKVDGHKSEQKFQSNRTKEGQTESVISSSKDSIRKKSHGQISMSQQSKDDNRKDTPSQTTVKKNYNISVKTTDSSPFIGRTNVHLKSTPSIDSNRRSLVSRTIVDKTKETNNKDSFNINIDEAETIHDLEKHIEHISINMPELSLNFNSNQEKETVHSVTSGCLTLPQGSDLDQVLVGQGRFQHRQLFENAYRVGNLIGRGGFGSVYAGVRLTDNKMVAIKHVAREKIRLWCSASGASVPKEICLMRHSHGLQNVIRLLDFYERPDAFILIISTPSCYKDLFDFITERGTLDEVLSQKFFKQILSSVRELKSRNVVHRDIKDENILVNLKTNNCFLIDFGSGCHFDSGILREFEGTHLYAPPEWLSSGQYSAESATVWSLGVLLYVMCQGDLPFPTEKEILAGDLTFKRPISVGARELVKECLTMNPRDRLNLVEIGDHPWVKQQISPIRMIPRSQGLRKHMK